MTAAQLIAHIGRTGLWYAPQPALRDGLRFRVTVIDARQVFGRLDYRIQPIAGQGAAWIEARTVTLDQEIGQ